MTAKTTAIVVGLVLAIMVACALAITSRDSGGGVGPRYDTHAALAEAVGCGEPRPSDAFSAADVMECTLEGETVSLRLYEDNSDRDEELELVHDLCGMASGGDEDVDWVSGDRWAVNPQGGEALARRVAERTGGDLETVSC